MARPKACEDDPIPCDGCPYAAQCKARELACHRFYRWTENGMDTSNLRLPPTERQFAALLAYPYEPRTSIRLDASVFPRGPGKPGRRAIKNDSPLAKAEAAAAKYINASGPNCRTRELVAVYTSASMLYISLELPTRLVPLLAGWPPIRD